MYAFNFHIQTYTAEDLKGLTVEHKTEEFVSEKELVLTLKDAGLNTNYMYSALRKETGKWTFSLIGDFFRLTACYSQTKHINMIPNRFNHSDISRDSHVI